MSPAAGNTSHLLSPYSPQLHLPSVTGIVSFEAAGRERIPCPQYSMVAVGTCAHVPRCRKGARSGQRGWGSERTPWSHRLLRRVSLSCDHCSDHGTSCRKLRRPDFQLEQFCVCSQGPHVASPVRSASQPGCLRILLRTSQPPSCPLARRLQGGGRGCASASPLECELSWCL